MKCKMHYELKEIRWESKKIKCKTHHDLKGAFEIEPVEEIAKAGVEHNQHQRDLRELMIEEEMMFILAWENFCFHSWF